MATHPMPDLQFWPQSGLSFKWAEPVDMKSSFDAHLGQDGVVWAMQMWVQWQDMQDVVTELLGYSYRGSYNVDDGHGVITAVPRIKRYLPWQHPTMNHLWVKAITKIEGVRSTGNSVSNPIDLAFLPTLGGAGAGHTTNTGPWSQFDFALITMTFWRPPYYVRTDADVVVDGAPWEWQRYLDKDWKFSSQMLPVTNGQMQWMPGLGNAPGFPSGVAQVVTHGRLTRKWYEIPEQCLFGLVNSVPEGLPTNLLKTQTETRNPVTGYRYLAGSPINGCVNMPIGGGEVEFTGDFTPGSAIITNVVPGTGAIGDVDVGVDRVFLVTDSDFAGSPIIPTGTEVFSVVSPTELGMSAQYLGAAPRNAAFTAIRDNVAQRRFLGMSMGTLKFLTPDIIPRPLQLPPYMMAIPGFGDNEPISQQQYDVVFNFDYFDPPRGPVSGTPPNFPLGHMGHNLCPFPATGLWYVVVTANFARQVDNAGRRRTLNQYFDPSDLFRVL